MANLVKFVSTSASGYAGITTPDGNTLYFLEDTEDLYKGSVKFTGAVVVYSGTRPASGVEGKLYVNASGSASIYTGGAWVDVAGNGSVEVSQTVLDGETPTTQAVSGVAVKSYVEGLNYAATADVVTDVAYDSVAKAVKFTKNGAESSLPLIKLGATIAYNGATGVISLKDSAGTELSTVNIPIDNFIKSGEYDSATHALVFTLQDDSTVTIPAADLVNLYDATDTNSVDVTIQSNAGGNNTISAAVKISAVANNVVTVKSDGLHVDKAAVQTIGIAADVGKIVTLDATGKLVVGTGTVGALATKQYVDDAVTWTTV
jgi:hypothetical protein